MLKLLREDVDVKKFVYFRRPTVASTLWACWLCMPKLIRIEIYYQIFTRFGRKTTSPYVTRLPFGLYAKHGRRATVTEALATQYVSVNTTIPVPTILDVLEDGAKLPFILMNRVPGIPLAAMPRTCDDLSDAQFITFAKTMRGWFDQLRRLRPLPSQPEVCGFLGTPFQSFRIYHDEYVGPFDSLAEFHSKPYCCLPPKADPQMLALEKRNREKSYQVFFTHGDISPNNILVDDNYNPVGLVDWACAAWMPEYWELTSSIYVRQRYGGWVRIFTTALPQYEEELRVETEMWKFVMPY
ncbi:hypothetical protein SCHPADRAFT_877319 [Schizopora paradoxa]|uniref:Aminoglycoside phosphotransferase domain-containing protein n=1 Tax=Schizopora paradoxa TaxID=27342 RepID=A0A0H2RNN6_9AGAM|nr:hypothetical protein SCHPADRAFT_877319 [Schizopora paradoxa]